MHTPLCPLWATILPFLTAILLIGCAVSRQPAPTFTPTAPAPVVNSTSPTQPRLDQTATTAHFQVTFSAPDRDSASELAVALEQQYARVTADLEHSPEGKVKVTIYPDLKQFYQSLGMPDAPDWVVSSFNGSAIQVVSPRLYPKGYIAQAAVHEFVHHLTSEINRAAPVWLHEGIAAYEAGQSEGVWKAIGLAVQKDNIPAFGELNTRDNLNFGSLNGYQYAYTIVAFAVQQFADRQRGAGILGRWVKSPDDFQGIFQLSQESFEQQWREYLKDRYPLANGCQARPNSIELACAGTDSGLQYWLYLPADSGQKPPLLIYLHGFNHSGSDLDRLQNGGLPLQIEHHRILPMLVVSPQCPSGDNWQNPDMVERLSAFINTLIDQYGADPTRVYLTGFSMGGDGAWALGIAHPEQFAVLAPVGSWYAKPSEVCALKDVPVWDFQGNMDQIVSPQYAREMVAALERCGGTVKLTIYPAANHEGSSGITYGTDELYQWMLEQRKGGDGETGRRDDAEMGGQGDGVPLDTFTVSPRPVSPRLPVPPSPRLSAGVRP